MKIKFSLISASLGAVLLLTATGAVAQLYRCTGSDGRIAYSDKRCAPNEQRQLVKITDNSMDNSNLRNTAAIQSGLGSSMSGGGVAVVGNSGSSSSSASSSSSSSPSPRPARRRCRG
ncbi:MAG: DUF4124 domain-containing protein [Burkholderiales bacterium]|jgi:hypothetical protein|nr:DUF4124 domain-containing protein [Burkholderiales bacterium]